MMDWGLNTFAMMEGYFWHIKKKRFLEYFWNTFGILLGYSWDAFRVCFGYFCATLGKVVEYFKDTVRILLG